VSRVESSIASQGSLLTERRYDGLIPLRRWCIGGFLKKGNILVSAEQFGPTKEHWVEVAMKTTCSLGAGNSEYDIPQVEQVLIQATVLFRG
jgi:hypothetical protein